MTLVRALVIGLAVAAGATAADDKKPSPFDAEKLVGSWKLTAVVKDGDKMEKPGGDVTVIKDKITFKAPDDMTFEFGYKLDPKTDPAGIDLEILAPEGFKGAKAKGIIALDGENVKLAYHPMNGDRPKNFEAKKGSGEFAFEWKKVEKK
jgi:uncharacterized protein (TIGR03067 family)